jgi:hypothetical protein
MIGLVIAILFFVLFLGLFAFDSNRAQMCQRELIAACDSASITGTAMLASYDTSPNGQVSLSIAQQLAAGYAYNMFRRAVVLGQPLNNAVLQNSPASLGAVSSPGQCNIIIALGDPNNDFKGITTPGDPAGRTVEIFACYGYQPSFLSAVPFGVKVTPLNAASFGGLPQVDAVVVFDFSGSMDDFTSVLFVRREWYWPATTGEGTPLYSVVTGATPGTNNLFSNYLKWNYTIQPAGSGTNVLPPQNVQAVGSGNTAVGNPLTYTNALRSNPIFCAQWLGSPCMLSGGNTDHVHYMPFTSPGGHNITLSSADYGQPPGNYKPVFVNTQSIANYQGVKSVANVTSLPPDSPLSDSNQKVDAYHTAAGNGTPSMWWNHRGFGGVTPATGTLLTNVSGTSQQTGSLLVSALTAQSQYVGNSTTATAVATDYEPNAWGVSLYSQQSATATYHAGYPPQASANNSPYLAIANDMKNDNQYFTDLVVNIVDPTGGGTSYSTQPIPPITASTISNFFFTGFNMTFPSDEPDLRLAGNSYNFQNLATVVEAARGNLDNTNNYTNACIDGNVIIRPYTSAATGAASVLPAAPTTTTAISSSAAVNAYWQLAYERIAMLESQPYATACDGAENGFFYKLSTLADCRFGLIGFSAISQSGSDSYGASNGNCLHGYPTKNDASQGTATAFSHLHSGVQYYYTSSNYYYGTGASGTPQNANMCWWRSNQTTTPTAGGASKAGAIAPTLAEKVWAFNPPSSTANQDGSGTDQGFKIPRTRLSTVTSSPTSSQLCMVASHASGTVAPYNVKPYGDVWSSTSSDGYANGVWNGRPMTDTYCDEALSTAYGYFSTSTNGDYNPALRYAARKTIVFFTDGEPTGGLTGTTANNSTAVANLCNTHQISLFTIGLNMDPTNNGTLTAAQYQFLGDGVNASYSGSQNGLAYTASNGSRFFQCQDGASVRSAFASIARRLSQAQL